MLHIPMDIVNSLRFIKIGTLAHWPIISFLYQSHHVKERLFLHRQSMPCCTGCKCNVTLDVDATLHLVSMQRCTWCRCNTTSTHPANHSISGRSPPPESPTTSFVGYSRVRASFKVVLLWLNCVTIRNV